MLAYHCWGRGKIARWEEELLPWETFNNLGCVVFPQSRVCLLKCPYFPLYSSSCTSWLLINLENLYVYWLVECWEPFRHLFCLVYCQILGKSQTWGDSSSLKGKQKNPNASTSTQVKWKELQGVLSRGCRWVWLVQNRLFGFAKRILSNSLGSHLQKLK